jgi:hypothetical protein
MDGLIKFAQTVEPGSAHVIASVGDERSSLILLTVRGGFGSDGVEVTLPTARLAMWDENQKLKQERAIFFVLSD